MVKVAQENEGLKNFMKKKVKTLYEEKNKNTL